MSDSTKVPAGQQPWVDLIEGDARHVLTTLPDRSVNCIVTSPPYFGLRDYGHPDQIGLEETPDEYVSQMVAVFREARRVLRDDGTLWLNLGDTYNNNPSTSNIPRSEQGNGSGAFQIPPERHVEARRAKPNKAQPLIDSGIKKKDLIGIPWRVAFALQADGWYLRQDIIWAKPNPMPESVRDRCTKSHEYIFLLSKSERYYFDADAIAEPSVYAPGKTKEVERKQGYYGGKWSEKPSGGSRNDGSFKAIRETRNKRDVWTIPTKGFKGAHFAVMAEAAVEPCVLAGCPEGGVVLNPFGGSGTVGVVARRHGRSAVLIELNPEYFDIASARLWPEEYAK